MKLRLPHLILFLLLGSGLACAPKFIPSDLDKLKDPQELGLASQEAYEKARDATDKKEKLNFSHGGILYSDKCIKKAPEEPLCLYYNVLNRGIYIKHHIPYYQRSLKIMVAYCLTLTDVDPVYEHAGCYRILGDIYAKAPSFVTNPDYIGRDLEKSSEYLRQAVRLAPDYPLNRLFLARTLEALGEEEEARVQLKEFDQLPTTNLDIVYPEWKKERDDLARKLQP